MRPPFNKRKQLAEQIIKILDGGPNKDTQISFPEAELLVDQAYGNLIKINLFSNYKFGEGFNVGQYLVTFEDVPVKNNEARNRNYIDIPARYLDLPGNRGLQAIGPMGNDYGTFIPIKAGGRNFTTITKTPFLQSNTGYEVEGLRAYFTSDLLNNNITKCLVQLVTSSSTEIDINLPADMDMSVIKEVFSILGYKKPDDKTNDETITR